MCICVLFAGSYVVFLFFMPKFIAFWQCEMYAYLYTKEKSLCFWEREYNVYVRVQMELQEKINEKNLVNNVKE